MAKDQAEFRVKAIEILGANLVKNLLPGEGIKNFSFNINIENKVDVNQKLVLIKTDVTIHDEATKQITYGSFSSLCAFEIINFDELIKVDETILVPDALLLSLSMISISTTRGLMFGHFKGTFLHYAYLPVIDLNALRSSEVATPTEAK